MKKITISIMTLSTIFLMSCGEKEAEVSTDEHQVEEHVEVKYSGSYSTNEGSLVEWNAKHYKDNDYVHHGTINISNGTIQVENGEIVGGEFTFDMASIVEPGTDTTQPWTLQGHFKTPDFFNIIEFPSSTFTVTSVSNGEITGDLSILGVAKEIKFPAEIEISENAVNASATFEMDLLQFGLPVLVEGETLPEEEKQEGANPVALFKLELSAVKAAL